MRLAVRNSLERFASDEDVVSAHDDLFSIREQVIDNEDIAQ